MRSQCNFKSARVDTFLFMVGQITGKMFDHPIEKDCVSDLSDPGSCRIGPVRQVAGPENAAIQNLAALQYRHIDDIFLKVFLTFLLLFFAVRVFF